jgi:hypothetical protein
MIIMITMRNNPRRATKPVLYAVQDQRVPLFGQTMNTFSTELLMRGSIDGERRGLTEEEIGEELGATVEEDAYIDAH